MEVESGFTISKELFISNTGVGLKKLSTVPFKGSPPKACFWSPDGTCLLTSSEDAHFRLYELPVEPPIPSHLSAVLDIPKTECIYDLDWYPRMSSLDPVSSVFLSSARASPIHLLDAFNASIRATYRCYNDADEVTPALSAKFDRRGDRIFAGLSTGRVHVFDTSLPGRDTLHRFGREALGLGRGIISSIAPHPAISYLFAAASYNRRAGIYDLRKKNPLLLKLEGQKSGITQASFSKTGDLLLIGGRKNSEILVWDLRNPGQLFGVLKRTVETNQRIYFDVLGGDLVISGSTDGSLRVYDLKASPLSVNDEPHIGPIWTQDNLHEDSLNCVHVHPFLPLLSTTSGQRHYSSTTGEDEDKRSKRDFSLSIWNLSFAQ